MEPPWGALTWEAVLLSRWDLKSAEKHTEQIERLINDLLVENGKGTLQKLSDPNVPTAEQIGTILRPWRTNAQREIADILNRTSYNVVWLRTCYSEGADPKHNKLVRPQDIELVVDIDQKCLLNDAILYNFGAHWQQIFYSIPEIISRNEGDCGYMSTRLREALLNLKRFEESGLEGAPVDLVQNLSFYSGTDLTDALHKVLLASVQDACVATWMIVEDEEALQTSQVWLLWLDCQGFIVRHKRIEVGDAVQVSGAWVRASWYEMEEWEEASIGDEYKSGGSRDITNLNKILTT